MPMQAYKSILSKYLPEDAVEIILTWLKEYNIHLRVARKRSSKLGDYRPPQNGKGHQITVNYDLNPYAFLITLVHEIAHLLVWERHRNRVRPHGREWKNTYAELMEPFFEMETFPDDIRSALKNYLSKSYASSGSDLQLSRVLRKYDTEQGITLEDIEEGSIFMLSNRKMYRKGERLRKRYRCLRLDNQRVYLVNPLAGVVLPESASGDESD